MGVRTRGLDIKAGAANLKADRAARAEAEIVVDRWNRRVATGRDMLWSPTIRAALIAGTPYFLPRLRDEPGDRSPDRRPPPAGLRRHAGARPTVLVVSGIGTNAEAARAVHAAAGAGDRYRTLKSLPLRHTVSKSKHCRDGVPPKSRKPAISERPFTGGEGSVKVEASSVGLRGAELRTIQQARIVVGATVLVIGVSATVFVIGALTGAGIAAWMMPPV
jgi:hypothetical protein